MNYSKKVYLSVLCLFIFNLSNSQSVSINGTGTAPDASAILDMSVVNNKGLLIPNITLTGSSDNTTITSPASGLMIYNTATAGDVTPGYYYYNGTNWERLANGSFSFENGITKTSSDAVRLGGTLLTDTKIDFDYYNLSFDLSTNGQFRVDKGVTNYMIFQNDGNLNLTYNISSGEYYNFDGIFGSSGYGFREKAGDLEYKKNTSSDWTAFPDAPPNGQTMWWYKPDATTYIRPQGNANVRVYDDGETYGFYYNGSSNQYGGYFVTSSATSPTSAVVGFSDVLGNQTFGYLGYNGTYDSGNGLTVEGSAVYGVVDDKNRAAIFGRTTKDATVAAIIGYSDQWSAGYFSSYDNASTSHSALYGQLIVPVTKSGNQTAVKGYSEYTEGTENRGYTIGGAFYGMGDSQDSEGIDTYAYSKGTGTKSWGIYAEVDSAETVYGIQVLAGTDGETTDCWGIYSQAKTSSGNAVLGLGSNLGTIVYTGYGDGVIGGSDEGVGVFGYFYDGSAANSQGYLGYSQTSANYFYHKETTTTDGQSAIKAYRESTGNAGTAYTYGYTNQAILGFNATSEEYTFGIAGYSVATSTRTAGVLGKQYEYNYWGALGYYSSSGSDYGGYFTNQGTGSGKNKIQSGTGIGSYGSFAGAWFRGEIYGTITKGERFAQYIDGKTYTNNLIVSLQDNGTNEKTATYVPVSTSADIYLRGTGQLSGGKAIIKFDKKYQNIISDKVPVIVTVTPIGESNGLHISSLKSNEFTVEENNKGKSNSSFTWIAIAVRKGYENPKNPEEVLSNKFDEKLDKFMFNENDTKNSGQPMWWDGEKIRYDALPKKEVDKKIDNKIQLKYKKEEKSNKRNKKNYKENQHK